MRRFLGVSIPVVLALMVAATAVAQLPPGGTFVDDDGNIHEPNIEAIAAAGITKGCNPPANDRYCPDDPVTRAQMAAFLLRGMGEAGGPPPYQGVFADVPAGLWYTGYAEWLHQLAITKGCAVDPLRYCPNRPVSRAEMAVFIVRAIGEDENLPAYQGYFSDVPPGLWYTGYAERLYQLGITVGCATDKYCPNDPITRDQMATFLARTFKLTPINPPPVADQPEAPIAAAFLYPWFPQAWDQGGMYPFTRFTPSWGLYDSSDPAIIDRQVAGATNAGLEAFIASWWGPGHHTDSATMAILNRIPSSPNPDFRVAVYYEEEGQSDPSVGAILNDLDYLKGLFDQSAYLRVDGKPVVFVWADGSDGPGMAARWADVEDRFGGDVYIVLKVYPGFADDPNQPDSWHQYGPAVAYSQHLPWSAVVSPGFWHANEDAPRLSRSPSRFLDDAQKMVNSGAFWQLVTSWNEWGEGTAVEPASEFGTTYLDLLSVALLGSVPPANNTNEEIATESKSPASG